MGHVIDKRLLGVILPADGSRSHPQVVPDVFAKAMGNTRRMSSARQIQGAANV